MVSTGQNGAPQHTATSLTDFETRSSMAAAQEACRGDSVGHIRVMEIDTVLGAVHRSLLRLQA